MSSNHISAIISDVSLFELRTAWVSWWSFLTNEPLNALLELDNVGSSAESLQWRGACPGDSRCVSFSNKYIYICIVIIYICVYVYIHGCPLYPYDMWILKSHHTTQMLCNLYLSNLGTFAFESYTIPRWSNMDHGCPTSWTSTCQRCQRCHRASLRGWEEATIPSHCRKIGLNQLLLGYTGLVCIYIYIHKYIIYIYIHINTLYINTYYIYIYL